jgi:hypothetical protein
MVECPECGDEYTNLAQHWHYSPSHRPELTQKQLEITVGSLMGDGFIKSSSNKNCYLRITMISPNYLKHVDDVFQSLGTGVKLHQTAAKSAKANRNTGFSPNAKKENYSDLYVWKTRCHPKFNEFREWYASGKKVWPENIKLTPTVLKHWYVGDGCYQNYGTSNYMEISMSNEVENTKKVSQYFTNVGLPEPSKYTVFEREGGGKNCTARWSVEDSYTLWKYMGEPLPDFEYKWPEKYR